MLADIGPGIKFLPIALEDERGAIYALQKFITASSTIASDAIQKDEKDRKSSMYMQSSVDNLKLASIPAVISFLSFLH